MDRVRQLFNTKLKRLSLGILALGVTRYIYCKLHRKIKKLPNGPNGIPIFCSFFSFLNLKKFLSNQLKYDGALSLVYFFSWSKPIIIINNADAAKHVLKHKNCQDRPPPSKMFSLLPFGLQWGFYICKW